MSFYDPTNELVRHPMSWTTVTSLLVIIILIAALWILYYKKRINLPSPQRNQNNEQQKKTKKIQVAEVKCLNTISIIRPYYQRNSPNISNFEINVFLSSAHSNPLKS